MTCDCGHADDAHYGSKDAWCNVNNCRCQALRSSGKKVNKYFLNGSKLRTKSFLSELREEIGAWHADVFDDRPTIPTPEPLTDSQVKRNESALIEALAGLQNQMLFQQQNVYLRQQAGRGPGSVLGGLLG